MIKKAAQYLFPKQAADYLNLSPKTLEKWRHTGEGPSFTKFGRAVRYDIDVLNAWAAKNSRSSTSEG
jgi:excisionase family DNA binding protein